jgi:hypothetical protein
MNHQRSNQDPHLLGTLLKIHHHQHKTAQNSSLHVSPSSFVALHCIACLLHAFFTLAESRSKELKQPVVRLVVVSWN